MNDKDFHFHEDRQRTTEEQHSSSCIQWVSVDKKYKYQPPIFQNCSLKLPLGVSISLQGPSGSGKTTFLNLLGGLDRAEKGEIWVDGENVLALPEKKLAQYRLRKIGFVFQSSFLLKEFNVLENVYLPHWLAFKNKKKAIEQARGWLEIVGLADKEKSYVHELSGGQCQRITIIRALINQAPYILADEPSGSLDQENAQLISDLLFNLVKEYKKTLILVTHEKQLADRCDHHYGLEQGKIIPL